MLEQKDKIPTNQLKRTLPDWAEIQTTINSIDIYNMSILDNIISWTKNIPDVPAIDYFGNIITFGELPERVREYYAGFKALGIPKEDVITCCMPVSVENNLWLFALNKAGNIQNTPNFLFLRNDFKRYTMDKGSHTLIILDAYLPFVVDYLEECQIKNVIVTNLTDYLLPKDNHRFDDLSYLPKKMKEIFCDKDKQKECQEKIEKLHSVRFVPMSELIQIGKNSMAQLPTGPVDIYRDVSYSYTSGTTGQPKCIVYKELSANALIELHIGVDTKDYVGERCFQVIPLTHATGERFCGYLQLARGKTLVPQPIYNKETFGKDLMESKCNWITAAPSFYMSGVAQGMIAPNAFINITRPSSGGEPVTKSNVILIDRWLKMNGCSVRFSIGGGAAEDGSSTICSYYMDERTKTNETGHPVEPGIIAKIIDKNGYPVEKGTRGFLHVSSAAAADRYLDNDEATAARWYTDEHGVRWGVTGDIAIQNYDESITILGRASDSYVDENGVTKYLFDIEYSLDVDDPVIEWEITAHKTNTGTYVVGQVVLKDEFKDNKVQVIQGLCDKYGLDSIKIYEKFESSEVTGKRDYQLLKDDKEGYFRVKDGVLQEVSYANDVRTEVK